MITIYHAIVDGCVFEEPPAGEKIVAIPQLRYTLLNVVDIQHVLMC